MLNIFKVHRKYQPTRKEINANSGIPDALHKVKLSNFHRRRKKNLQKFEMKRFLCCIFMWLSRLLNSKVMSNGNKLLLHQVLAAIVLVTTTMHTI